MSLSRWLTHLIFQSARVTQESFRSSMSGGRLPATRSAVIARWPQALSAWYDPAGSELDGGFIYDLIDRAHDDDKAPRPVMEGKGPDSISTPRSGGVAGQVPAVPRRQTQIDHERQR